MARTRSDNVFMAMAIAIAMAIMVQFASSVKAEEIVEEEDVDYIVPLDHTNFTDFVFKQDFVVVEFYAPWCGACKGFYPKYKEAAKELQSHDPPIILAKIDASADENNAISEEYEIKGFPTIKTFRKQGKYIEEYFATRKVDALVSYFKKLYGPPSVEIKSKQDVAKHFDDKRIYIVGLFPEFSGEEYENFTTLAETMRTRYDFGHTSDANVLPRRERFNRPTLRLFKPFDELFVDFQDFDVTAMKKFIQRSATPILTIFDGDELNKKYVDKFFDNPKTKAMLLVNFSREYDAFKPKFYDLAKFYQQKGIIFLFGDTKVSGNLIQYFGLNKNEAPLIIVYDNHGTKYLKNKVAPEDIATWLKDFKDEKLEQYIKSQPIPEVNNQPIKIVVRDTLQKFVLDSEKDVLLELYESVGCTFCKRLAPILDEVAVEFQNDEDIMIAKLDTNANDISNEIFKVEDFPTMYLKTATGKIILYEGSKRYNKEDIIEFIQKNRDTPAKAESITENVEKTDSTKDEL